jgi:aromatic ring hydroxylase
MAKAARVRTQDREAFAARPETTGKVKASAPQTGADYLASLSDGREVYIYGQRVKDVTKHEAFRNTARMVARLYDALHDKKRKDKILLPTETGNGGVTHAFFKAPKTLDEMIAGRNAIAEWAKLTYGWMGRAPDYKAAFLATLGANADFYEPYQDNAKRWYKFSQERVPFINHAIIHPPVDRDRPPNEVGDVCCHVEKETDAGIIVSGAKVVATGSVLTNYTFVAHHGLIPVQDKKFAVVFMVPTNTPGVKFICRTSYEMAATAMGSPFDYPLSSRLDENDAVFILDKVLVPWENVFVYGDVEKAARAANGGGTRRSPQGRNRKVVAADQGRQHQGRMSANRWTSSSATRACLIARRTDHWISASSKVASSPSRANCPPRPRSMMPRDIWSARA